MSFKTASVLLLAGAVVLSSGCATVVGSSLAMKRMLKRQFKLRPTDYRDASDQEFDEWSDVGQEGRGNQMHEIDPDPWWRKYIMSQQARNIEHNLGYD